MKISYRKRQFAKGRDTSTAVETDSMSLHSAAGKSATGKSATKGMMKTTTMIWIAFGILTVFMTCMNFYFLCPFSFFSCGLLRSSEIAHKKENLIHSNPPTSTHQPTTFCSTTFDMKKIAENERGFLLFVAPKSFDEVPINLKKWKLYIEGIGHLIILSNDSQTRRASALMGISTLCIEHSLDGFPRFDLMMAKMEHMQPDGVVAFANSDLDVTLEGMFEFVRATKWIENKGPLNLITPDTFLKPYKISDLNTKFWFAALNRWNYDNDVEKLKEHNVGGYDVWAWNIHQGGPSLLPFDIPPFQYPLASYDNWLMDIVNKEATRNVIDFTGVTKFTHKEHSRKNYTEVVYHPNDSSIGFYLNRYLALHEPRSSTSSLLHHCVGCGTLIGSPYYISRNGIEGDLILKERKSYQHHIPHRSNELVEDMTKKKRNSFIKIADDIASKFNLQALVSERANKEGFVLLTSVTYNYREYLLNFICNLERIGNSFQHMVIAALDDDMYKWGALRGLPVFLPIKKMNNAASAEQLALFPSECKWKCYYDQHKFSSLNMEGSEQSLSMEETEQSAINHYLNVGARLGLDCTCGQTNDNITAVPVSSEYDYGSHNFRKLTKMKSRSTLAVMNAGYSVVYSDVDITWFRDPFEALSSHTAKHSTNLMIQSNAPYAPHLADPEVKFKPHSSVDAVQSEQASNGFRRINSGMYVAPNSALMRLAFEQIISTAENGTLSEQPYFYDVLCNKYPSRTMGVDGCEFHSSEKSQRGSYIAVQMLDRLEYVHGAVGVGGNAMNIYTSGVDVFENLFKKKVVMAHNNWVVGKDAKKERQVQNNWWYIEKGFCKYMGDV